MFGYDNERVAKGQTIRVINETEAAVVRDIYARLLLRRLIGPLVRYDESTRPYFIKADAEVKPGLLDGLAEIQDVASPTGFDPFSVVGSVGG